MVVLIYFSIPIGSVLPKRGTNTTMAVTLYVFKICLQFKSSIRLIAYMLLLAIVAFIQQTYADATPTDTVYFQAQDPEQGAEQDKTRQLKGTIADFSGQGLRIISPNGQESLIPADSVIRIDTQRTPAQRAARLATKADQHTKAASTYYRLLQSEGEKRNWVRREILSELVLALRADGNYYQATKTFLQLLRDDPRTPYFNVIPLVWTGGTTLSPEAETTATRWLESQDRLERLLGSSLLLSSRKSQQAERVLNALAETATEPINSLAQAQWLRLRLPQATEQNIHACEQTIKQLPLSLQGGPYYILGRLYLAKGENRKAAVAAMRVPILYNGNPNLAAEALLTAGKAASQAGLIEDAKEIYSELINTYPKTTAAVDAQQRKSALNEVP